MKDKREGTKKGSRVLNKFAVQAIKTGLADGTPGRILARIHGTTESNVSLIRRGKRWQEVQIPS